MIRVAIRKVRQNLSSLLKIVKIGCEILVTEHGRPVSRLAPIVASPESAFPDLARFRAKIPVLTPPLSETVLSDRADRL